MIFDRYRVSDTQSVERMVDEIMYRHPQFIRLDARPEPGWGYTFNRVEIGSVRIGVTRASHVHYESIKTRDVIITGCFHGVEAICRGGETRHVLALPTFAPTLPVIGEVKNAKFYTVRLCPEKLAEFLLEMEADLDLSSVLETNWLMALPSSPMLSSFLRYVFNYLDRFGVSSSREAWALEDLIYANTARTLLFDKREHSVYGNFKIFKRCVDYIDANLADDISIRDIARVSGMSLRRVQDIFRQNAENTITGYIRERRLLRAREMLTSPGMANSVSEVSLATGFRHVSHFGQLYRQRFGETPSITLRSNK